MGKVKVGLVYLNSQPFLDGTVLKCIHSLRENGYLVTLIKLAPPEEVLQKKKCVISDQLEGKAELYSIRLSSRLFSVRGLLWLKYFEFIMKSLWACLGDYDCLVGFDVPALFPAYVAGRLKRRPVMYFNLELYTEQNWAPGRLIWRLLSKFLSPKVDSTIVLDKNRAEYLCKNCGVKSPKVILNTPKYRSFSPSDELQKLLISQGYSFEQIAIYVGRISPERGVDEMIACLPFLKNNIGIVMIGLVDELYLKEIQQRIAEMDLVKRVVVLPWVEPDKVWNYMFSSHCGLVLHRPLNLNYVLNAGATNKLFEYIMAGLPVVAPQYPGYADLLEKNGIGLCVNASDPKSIAKGITDLLSDEKIWLEMRERALSLAKERFNWEIDSRVFLEEIKRVVGSGKLRNL